ncbi:MULTISPECIES: SDR family NAD(P)-dependent oxidoreductase [Burkholderia]|jgi:NAD(P)-dependent dehydrogenase (short-subunit alcohol dehydrogenase family)|uniref:SDR family NAD(P)-dependent oxidoreductase n=1 Tax=Burkholderia TaxID=32008 RepID=UPI00080B3236|nr:MULTISPECIES: SDR family oxidoreductase [Burkholderia]MCA8477952.1 SDR family oxidoreductase [Burkholderia multivorans]MDR9052477.1 Aklaviketone reductase DauE [Burkholderia multivorans]MDR9058421.1 Aklaviketone reductase DauE [Burkholderia multivorans]MDR9062298.1 Aklaviketone reductase DauE [Burkholderia multivorans]MDR9070225.1 Aklaviketone reductase DauE [Burkholderia multivorans]
MPSFDKQVVLITGGGAGIGLAAAVAFAREGAHVVITGRREAALAAIAQSVPGVSYVVADAGNAADAARTVDAVIARCGRLDVLVNNAGAGAILPLSSASFEAISAIFAVNTLGPSLLASAALPHLTRVRGSIVNVSSTYGHKAAALLSHYAASKAALEHMTRCWALELAPAGVRVNAVAAGPTETEFLSERMSLSTAQVDAIKAQERERIPLGRRGEPEDVAAWIVAMTSPQAAWMTGQVVTVDGGLDAT